MAIWLAFPLHKHLPARARASDEPRLRDLLAGAWVPVIGLTLLFALQEVHVIVVKHEASEDAAGSYAVAAVAAKAIIWVAVGLGMYLLPEAARRAAHGRGRPAHPRPHARADRRLRAADDRHLRGGGRAAARRRLRRGPHRGAGRAALPRHRDGAARLRLPVGAVPAGARALRASSGCSGRPRPSRCCCLRAIGADLESIALALMALQFACAAVVLTLSFRGAGRGIRRRPPPPAAPAPVS